jgi:hypothetical protein
MSDTDNSSKEETEVINLVDDDSDEKEHKPHRSKKHTHSR